MKRILFTAFIACFICPLKAGAWNQLTAVSGVYGDEVFPTEPLPCATSQFDPNAGDDEDGNGIAGVRPATAHGDQLFPSFWRNERTGDWELAFLDDGAIYRCKCWTYDRREVNAKTGKAELVLRCGDETLPVRVGKQKKGRRAIQVGKSKQTYTLLTGPFVPDYPVPDKRTGFVNNGNRPDTVTVTGWLCNLPKGYKLPNTFTFFVPQIFGEDWAVLSVPLDAQGRFTARVPVINTCNILSYEEAFQLDPLLLEPGHTYFMYYDFKDNRRYLMGDDVRLQNELLNHPRYEKVAQMPKGGSLDRYIATVDSTLRARFAAIDSGCQAYPSLSARYRKYQRDDLLWRYAFQVGQARFKTKDLRLTDAARRYAHHTFWTKLAEPLTLYMNAFDFIDDYFDEAYGNRALKVNWDMSQHIDEVARSDEELALLKRWVAITRKEQPEPKDSAENAAFYRKLNEIVLSSSMARKMANAQGHIDWMRDRAQLLDSLHTPSIVKDFVFYKEMERAIVGGSEPVLPQVIDTFRTWVDCPLAVSHIEEQNRHYQAIENQAFDQLVVKSSDNLKDLTEGEALLKKLLEPYKGTFVLLDIWGTWCGPCKEALSHSTEEYERLSKYGVTFLYLANSSSEDAWKNVIKEYHVTGDNVAHYRLPDAQQEAIERHLNVHSFPTYKLFDRDGNLLNLHVDARELDKLEELFKQLSNSK